MNNIDWLSNLLDIVTVRGRLEVRCLFGAPWREEFEKAPADEIPYHVILAGRAVLEIPNQPPQQLEAGTIFMAVDGSPHVLHDGTTKIPTPIEKRRLANIMIGENKGSGAKLDMLCGRFLLRPPYDKLMRKHLPSYLVVKTTPDNQESSNRELANLIELIRDESVNEQLGGVAMLNALSTALMAMALRHASKTEQAASGLLALANNPRLAPALNAMFRDPAYAWTLPELAELCNMSRATFVRHFQETLACSATDYLTDIRMSKAAQLLRESFESIGAIAERVGYQSEAAFQRAFKQHIGASPAQWRKSARIAIAS
jgi:AraC family transcriptional activator of mtrCDE